MAANKAKKVKNAYEPVSDSRIGNWGTMIPPTRASEKLGLTHRSFEFEGQV